jgi:hypothetical protein
LALSSPEAKIVGNGNCDLLEERDSRFDVFLCIHCVLVHKIDLKNQLVTDDWQQHIYFMGADMAEFAGQICRPQR